MPLPAPLESVPAPERLELDDLDVETLPRTAPVPPKPAPERPGAIPRWALIASGALLCAAVATTVALVL